MPTLQERLGDLASEAPLRQHPGDLWQRGRRLHRRRTATAAAALLALVVALSVGMLPLLGNGPGEPLPADRDTADLHLPRTVHAPHPWARGTADAGQIGPLAAVGLAHRNLPDGVFGERREQALFGVSAVDGTSRWLDEPELSADVEMQSLVGWFALSPDGRWLGWVRHEPAPESDTFVALGSVTGWAVMDTLTGEVRELEDPRAPRPLGTDVFEIEFSGDSRYLLTNYSRTGNDSRSDRLVAWDVTTGERIPVEEDGHYWLPSLGSAPTGVVWSRGRDVHRVDPASGRRSTVTLPGDVVEASWGPDDRAMAWIEDPEGNGPWALRAGPSIDAIEPMSLGVQPSQLLGWTDDRHVVVGHDRQDVRIVDVVTGTVERERVEAGGGVISVPLLAADLWANDLVEAGEPPTARDPRRPWYVAGGVAVGAGILVVLVLLARRRLRA